MLQFANRYHLTLIASLTAVASTTIGSIAAAQDPSAMPIPNGDEPPWVSIILAGTWALVEVWRKIEAIRVLRNSELTARVKELEDELEDERKGAYDLKLRAEKAEIEARHASASGVTETLKS